MAAMKAAKNEKWGPDRTPEGPMIIPKPKGFKLDDPVGEFFQEINVASLKSPNDRLTIPELYAAIGFAAVLVGKGYEGRPVDPLDVTVTLAHEERSDEVIAYMQSLGMTCNKAHPGVYRFAGGLFPIQLVAYSELEDDRWLLTRSLTTARTPEMREKARAAMQRLRAQGANKELLDRIARLHDEAEREEQGG